MKHPMLIRARRLNMKTCASASRGTLLSIDHIIWCPVEKRIAHCGNEALTTLSTVSPNWDPNKVVLWLVSGKAKHRGLGGTKIGKSYVPAFPSLYSLQKTRSKNTNFIRFASVLPCHSHCSVPLQVCDA